MSTNGLDVRGILRHPTIRSVPAGCLFAIVLLSGQIDVENRAKAAESPRERCGLSVHVGAIERKIPASDATAAVGEYFEDAPRIPGVGSVIRRSSDGPLKLDRPRRRDLPVVRPPGGKRYRLRALDQGSVRDLPQAAGIGSAISVPTLQEKIEPARSSGCGFAKELFLARVLKPDSAAP